MVIFTTWMKLYSAEYFCNTWLVGLGEIFIQWKFWRYGIKIKLTSLLWLSANPPVNMADMTSQWEQRTSLWLWTRGPSTLNVTSEKGGCGRSIKKEIIYHQLFAYWYLLPKFAHAQDVQHWKAGPGDRSFMSPDHCQLGQGTGVSFSTYL